MRPPGDLANGTAVTVNGVLPPPPPPGLSPCEGRAAGEEEERWRQAGAALHPAARAGHSGRLLAPPLLLEPRRRQVAQRRVDPLDVVGGVEEAAELCPGVVEVLVVGQLDLLF